jgi:hypothetical protein
LRLREPYERRPIRFLEEWRGPGGWRLKIYGISYRRPEPRAELIETAKRLAGARLPQPAAGEGRYGVGFAGVHDGRGANFIFVSWWADENELHHHVYAAPSEELKDLAYITPTGLVACVWDLRVMAFERQSWLDEVLTNGSEPDVEAYMACRLNEEV